MKILEISNIFPSSFQNKKKVSLQTNNKKQNINFCADNKKDAKMPLDHADILTTHQCPKCCPTCVDKWVNAYKKIIDFDIVKKYFNMLQQKTYGLKTPVNLDGKILINVLGGEPTVVGEDLINKIADDAHIRDFMIWISTNGIKKDVIRNILPNMDRVRITVDTPEQVLPWVDSEFRDKIEIKFPCTGKTTLEDFYSFVEQAKPFSKKMMIVYNDANRREIKLKPEMAEFLNDPKIEYKVEDEFDKYATIDGVTIKRIAGPGGNPEEESELIPRLYPTGVYNCTWANEDSNPYLGNLEDF